MASKTELYNACSEELRKLGVEDKVIEVVNKYYKPKSGRAVDIESVVKRDAQGNITHLQCSVSGKFLPADTDYFYEDKSGKGIEVDGVFLKRLSKQAEGVRKKHIAAQRKVIDELTNKMLNKEISVDEGNKLIAEAKALKPDFSKIAE